MYAALPSPLTLFKKSEKSSKEISRQKYMDPFWTKFDLFFPDTGQKRNFNKIKYVLFYSINDPLIPDKKFE